ncbi:MAG: EpsG family protein [Eubacteriales bacterium]
MYFIILALGLILSAINDKKHISFKLLVLILLVFAFLRYGVGTDYFSYNFLYDRLNPSLFLELTQGVDNQEIGFRLFGSLLKGIGFSYQFYLIIIAFINIFFISLTCSKYSKNPTFSLLIYYSFYYLVWTFSGLRQGIVIAIGVYYLLEYIQKNKHLRFLLIVLLLTTIHLSALILIPLYFASKINFKKKTLLIILLSSLAFAMIPWGNILKNFIWIPFISRIILYIDTSTFSLTRLLDFQSIGRFVFLIIIFFYYDSYARQNEVSKKILNIYIISMILYFVFKFSELTAARLSIYGKILDMIILANTYYLYKERINRILYSVLMILLLVVYFNKELVALKTQTGLVTESQINIPYTSIIDKERYEFDNSLYEILYPDESS